MILLKQIDPLPGITYGYEQIYEIEIEQGTVGTSDFALASDVKVGFFGVSPVVQQTMGSATASGSWGATEQAMLQAVYNAVRAVGIGDFAVVEQIAAESGKSLNKVLSGIVMKTIKRKK